MWARERRTSVRELQAASDANEFAEWCAFQELNPATEERADLRSAIVASVIANLFTKRGSREPVPADFMPNFDRKPQGPRRQTTAEMRSVLEALARRQKPLEVKDPHG